MTTFGDALKQGLEAHKRAGEARKEMDEVLAAASAEVTAIAGSPITLQIEVIDRLRNLPLPGTKFTALTARLGNGAYSVLAEVIFGQLGYPVTFRWEHHLDTAIERASFEEVLKTILADVATGKKIASLLSGE